MDDVSASTPGARDDGSRLWDRNCVRLFLSHITAHKVAMGSLKYELRQLGVCAFVAHADIEPSELWRGEILLALESMHAMCCVLTPGFHESQWTDQEVGYAIARGVPLIPVNVGVTPYGFMGAHQALPGDLTDPKAIALAIARVLVRKPFTAPRMAEALVRALESANSFATAKAVTTLLEGAPTLDDDQLERLGRAASDNPQVNGSFGVPERIEALVNRQRWLKGG